MADQTEEDLNYDQLEQIKQRSVINIATKTPPDKYAAIRKIKEQTGLPADVIERNKDEIQRRQRNLEIESVLRSSPILAEKFKNPEFAQLAHDDVDNLFKTEASFSAIKGADPTFMNIAKGVAASLPQGVELTRQGIRLQWADFIGSERMRKDAQGKYDLAQLEVQVMTPELGPTGRGIYSGLTSTLRQIPGFIGSLITKSPVPALASMGQMTQAEAYGKYKARGATPGEAFLGAGAEGTVEVLTELAPMGFLVKKFGKVGAGEFLKGLLGRELPSEQIATLAQDAIDTAIANPDKTWGDYLKERPGAAYQTLLATLVQSGIMGGASAGMSSYQQKVYAADKAFEDKESIDISVDSLIESKFRKTSPEQFRDFVDTVLGAENNVYIAPEDATAFFQSNPEVLDMLSERAPDVAASINESLQSQSDVIIPKADYFTYLPEYHSELSNVIRSDQDGFTAKEAKEFIQGGQEMFEKEATELLTEGEKQLEFEASADVVKNNIKEQVLKTGQFTEKAAEQYAVLHKAFAKTIAERANTTPEELYSRFGLKVEGVQEFATPEQPAQKVQPSPEEIQARIKEPTIQRTEERRDGERAVPGRRKAERRQDIARREKVQQMTPEEQYTAIYGHELTGLNNRRAFNEDLPNAEVVLSLDVDALKTVNDYLGQSTGDELLKTVANALHEVSDNAYHISGDEFYMLGNNKEELIQQAQAAQEILKTKGVASKKGSLEGIGFSFGVAEKGGEAGKVEADSAMKEDKKVREAAGTRAGRGELPKNLQLAGEQKLAQGPVDQTKTDAFKEWFKDSKVVDENGKPLVVYHGTSSDINEFKKETIGKNTNLAFGEGFYFTSIPENANYYATEINGYKGGNVMPVYLSIKSPLEVTGIKHFRTIIKKEKERLSTTVVARDRLLLKTNTDLLKELGYDGVIFRSNKKINEAVAFTATQIKSQFNVGAFDPNAPEILKQDQRGAFIPEKNLIQILENADLSTFLHESGHFFLEAMNSIPELSSELDIVFNWFGTDKASWDQMSLDEKREHHEKFARGFEAYLFEGKSPSLELQTMFQRFRDWLVNIYRELRNLNVQLTPEVRQVFDRMLASDEQIRQAQVARSYAPVFNSIEESGLTPREWEEYQKLEEGRRLKSREELDSRSIKDLKWMSNAKARALKYIQKEVADKRKAMREEVTKEVEREQVFLAQRFLRRGERVNEDNTIEKIENHRLDIDSMTEILPDKKWQALGHGKYGMLSKDGIDPIYTANQLGYKSVDEMVTDLLEAPNKKAYIDEITDRRMLETYGDISDPIQMQRAAEEAIHNQVHTKFLHTELSALTKGVGNKNILAKAAKDFAKRSLSQKKVRDIKPHQYLASQARASENTLKALSKGDRESAIDHKRAQVLNNHFYRESLKARDEIEKALRYVRKFTKEGTRKNIDSEYLEQIDDLLGTFEFKNVSLEALDKRQSLADFIKDQEDIGFQPIIDEELVNETKRINYKNLTLEQLRGHIDTIENIEHLGRLKKTLLTAKDKREFQKRIDEANLSIELLANRKAKVRGTPTDVLGKGGLLWRQYLASHRKFASIIREMDGGQDGGVMWNLLLRTMNEAGDKETELKAEATQDLGKLFDQVKLRTGLGNLIAPKYLIPGTDISLTDEQRIMVAMNWGNEGNRQRLLDGGIAGKPELSEAEVRKILDTLSKEEWGLVQGTWDFLETYRNQIGEQERRLTGKTPKWVDPAPVETKYGTFKGGYFPAKYDRLLSTRSDELEAVTDLRMGMKGAFGASATRSGYAKERAREVKGRPLSLSFNTITQHTNEVVHRLAWQDWLTDANRVIKALDSPIREYYGPEILHEMKETVKDIAQGDAPAVTPVEQAINHLRIGSTITGMGWRISTALIQPSGLAQSWVRVGGPWVAKGVKQFVTNPLKASRMVNEKSKLMRDRDRTLQREVNEVLNSLRLSDKTAKFKASYFFLISKMQRTVDIPTWIGAYEKALVQMEIEIARDQAERDEIESKAIGMADQAVLDSQSGGQIKDLARVQRGHPFYKLLTNFYSYFSATYNLNVEAFKKLNVKSPASVLNFASDMIILNSLPVLFTVALREMMKGECDDLECIGQKVTEEQVSYLFGQFVLLRELGAGAQVVAGGKAYGYSGPAGLRPLADLYKLSVQAKQGELDEGLRKAILQTTGSLLHLPTGQVNTIIDGFNAIENGEVKGARSVLAPMVGPPRE